MQVLASVYSSSPSERFIQILILLLSSYQPLLAALSLYGSSVSSLSPFFRLNFSLFSS
jgi:hypothetical protein